MMKPLSCAGQAEVVTRGTKRGTDELLKSISTIAEQPTPKKKPKQCRLPRSYRPRVGTTSTNTSGNSNSTSPTTKQSFNHNSTSPISPRTPRKPPTPITTSPHHISSSHPSHTRKLTLRTSGLIPLPCSPTSITTKHTRLSPTSHALLLQKASQLSQYEPLILPRSFRRHKANTVDATLAFAQSEAGTAFCIREDGLLLTAAHCVAEPGQGGRREVEERIKGMVFWLVMPVSGEDDGDDSGVNKGGRGGLERGRERPIPKSRIVGARCIAWDSGRDLALLKVTHAQTLGNWKRKGIGTFPCVKLPPRTPKPGPGPASGKKSWKEPSLNTPVVAIGHPADEHPDDPPGVKAYGSEHRRVLQLSLGRYLGIAPDKVDNPQDNSDTGAMQHDCWTYWGHSGGPIFERDSGVLVGVHVDWNPEEPLVKRAVPWVAVDEFLKENGFWS
ncbi:trypsin-like cysteine/serine peptidase domain-containing protein [Copromyces sp. CBS 386.78]|nr:trypsin-like cysteine/serine peptidase domain-containing protein [Copromyces sp. CBS 386.78]